MAPDKLKPNDPRVQSLTATVRGKTYHYFLGKPEGTPKGTVLLVHGWPDLAFGWRYQVPLLMSMGLQVIVPDQLGFGGTDAPQEIEKYSLKNTSDDLADLAAQIAPGEQVILGGHDWGGALVWRMTLWHPELVRAVFSVCTPYAPPLPVYVDYAALTARLPNFRYQVQLAGPDVEREIAGERKLRGFLSGMYYGRGPAGERVFSTDSGVLFENVDRVGESPLLDRDEMDYYVAAYARNGMRGPLNWYRTRKVNAEEEMALLDGEGRAPRIRAPAMVILATNDRALPPRMADGMEQYFDSLRKTEVPGTHWALWDCTERVNSEIKSFVEDVLGSGPVKAAI